MHSGVYQTLEVMDFYHRGGGSEMGIDLPKSNNPFDNLWKDCWNLSQACGVGKRV